MEKIVRTHNGGHAWANLVCARDELRERVPYRVVRKHQKPRAGVDARQHRLPLGIIFGPYHSVCHPPARTHNIPSEFIDRCTIHLFLGKSMEQTAASENDNECSTRISKIDASVHFGGR